MYRYSEYNTLCKINCEIACISNCSHKTLPSRFTTSLPRYVTSLQRHNLTTLHVCKIVDEPSTHFNFILIFNYFSVTLYFSSLVFRTFLKTCWTWHAHMLCFETSRWVVFWDIRHLVFWDIQTCSVLRYQTCSVLRHQTCSVLRHPDM